MAETNKNKGPWRHRVLVGTFTILFSIMSFWLLDFAVDDIGTLPGPRREDVEKKLLSAELLSQRDSIDKQLAEVNRSLDAQRERQSLLRDSTGRYVETLRQLLDMQRLNAQKGLTASQPQQRALAESANMFLANQQQDQLLYEDILKLSQRERQLGDEKRGVEEKLGEQRKTADQELARLDRLHDRKLAGLKLLLLIPLLVFAVMLIGKKRVGMYGPLVYGAAVAILCQTVLVIHQHFPTRYFKYILLSASIVITGYILVWLLRMVRSPKQSWLLKQYRDAYEAFFCPICDYPIRRGPRRYLFWTRRTVGKIASPTPLEQAGEEPYSCPACGSRLYEACTKCKAIRHSLLPFCENCSAEKMLAAQRLEPSSLET
ncbi:MAG TPA: hypothetical protein VNX88_14825 [Terriglobales bacterium]|jgi:hypothetical protein|nr:hypothetical protein [Terriglobales bacterium]